MILFCGMISIVPKIFYQSFSWIIFFLFLSVTFKFRQCLHLLFRPNFIDNLIYPRVQFNSFSDVVTCSYLFLYTYVLIYIHFLFFIFPFFFCYISLCTFVWQYCLSKMPFLFNSLYYIYSSLRHQLSILKNFSILQNLFPPANYYMIVISYYFHSLVINYIIILTLNRRVCLFPCYLLPSHCLATHFF